MLRDIIYGVAVTPSPTSSISLSPTSSISFGASPSSSTSHSPSISLTPTSSLSISASPSNTPMLESTKIHCNRLFKGCHLFAQRLKLPYFNNQVKPLRFPSHQQVHSLLVQVLFQLLQQLKLFHQVLEQVLL
jgi:hypothetical protein